MNKRAQKDDHLLPQFMNEDAEREFWTNHDAVDYFRFDHAVTFQNLKPSTTAISLRVPVSMLNALKSLANKQDVPYQSLMKVYLADRIQREHSRNG